MHLYSIPYSYSTLSHISQLQKAAIKTTTRYHPWMYFGALGTRRDCCCGFTPVGQSTGAKFLLLAQLAGDLYHHLIHDAGLCYNHSYCKRGMPHFLKKLNKKRRCQLHNKNIYASTYLQCLRV